MSDQEREVQRRVQAIRDQEQREADLKAVNSAGESAYGEDWSRSLDRLATFGPVDPEDFAAILGTDAPEKVLHDLGKDPAEYQRIMLLPPAKRRNELIKVSLRQAAPKPVSTPEPAKKTEASPSDPDADWYAKRQARLRSTNATRRRVGATDARVASTVASAAMVATLVP